MKISLSEQIESDDIVQGKNRDKTRHRQDEDESVSDVNQLNQVRCCHHIAYMWFNLYDLFQFVDSRLTARILKQARQQQKELEEETGITQTSGDVSLSNTLGPDASDHSEDEGNASDGEDVNVDYTNPVSIFFNKIPRSKG